MSKDRLQSSEQSVLKDISFPPELGLTYERSGKVGEIWRDPNDNLVITRTDRVSVGDEVVGEVPNKGAVNNLLSNYWMNNTTDIIPNALIAVPDSNVSIMKPVRILPVEFVVRGYITGVTNTSLAKKYESGRRVIYGYAFPDGLNKNDKLPEPIITPTTKAEVGLHDEEITRDTILREKLMTEDQWDQAAKTSIAIYNRIYEKALSVGLVFMDMKIEIGEDEDGKLLLADEVGTSDAGRYALLSTFNERKLNGVDPEFYDKEFYRILYKMHGSVLPQEVAETSRRYGAVFERITGQKIEHSGENIQNRIIENLREFYGR